MKNPSYRFELGQMVRVPGWDQSDPPLVRITARRFEETLDDEGNVVTDRYYQVEVAAPDGLSRTKVGEDLLAAEPD